MAGDPWSDEKVAALKVLHKKGLSASQIASGLVRAGHENTTRLSVISKIHRLGLSGPSNRPRTVRQSRPKNKINRPPATRSLHSPTIEAAEVSVAFEELVIPHHERMSLLVMRDGKLHANESFTDRCCRWPIGDPQDAEFHFCGKEKVPGIPYCEFHGRRAFVPQTVKTKGVKNDTATKVEPALV